MLSLKGVEIPRYQLGKIVRRHPHELFSHYEEKKVLDRVNEVNSKAVEDLVRKLLSLEVVQKVLQDLLRERVSIRDAVSIRQALGEAAPITKNTVLLTEYLWEALRRQVLKPLPEPSGNLSAYFLDPVIEQSAEFAVGTPKASHLNLSPQRTREIQERLKKCSSRQDAPSVIVTVPRPDPSRNVRLRRG